MKLASVRAVVVRLSMMSPLLIGLMAPSAQAAVQDDALARSEFDKELSLDMKGLGIVNAFRTLAQLVNVPFILDFDPDPSLLVTVKAENMVARSVFASLAGSYELEYAFSDAGIVVKRRGSAPSTRKVTVGAWPLRPGGLYQMNFEIRDAQGQIVSSPHLRLQTNVAGMFAQGGPDFRAIQKFDRKRGIIEPQGMGGIQLTWIIQREVGGQLDLAMELVTTRALTDESYSEEHLVAQKRVARGETILFKTSTHQVTLVSWARIGAADGKPPADQPER